MEETLDDKKKTFDAKNTSNIQQILDIIAYFEDIILDIYSTKLLSHTICHS